MSSPESQSSDGLGKHVRFGDFLVDLEAGTLRRGQEDVSLRPKTFDVLTYLITHQGRLVTRSALIDAVWQDTAVTDNSLSHCLLEIRRALGDDSQQLIRTVAKRGYIFTAPVLTVPESPSPPETVAVAPSLSIGSLPLKGRIAAVAALALIAITASIILRSQPEPATAATQFTFTQFTDRPGRELFPSLTSDGSFVAYTARDGDDWDVHLQRIGAGTALNLTRDCSADD